MTTRPDAPRRSWIELRPGATPAATGAPVGTVSLVHEYLTRRGGAERRALAMAEALPGAPLHTSLYQPESTSPGFAHVEVRPLGLNRLGVLRKHHRLALSVLAPAFSLLRVDADVVVVCSSSGWAHGVVASGRKVVYCRTPARWLYQAGRYLGGATGAQRGGRRAFSLAASLALGAAGPPLRRWDRSAAGSAARYLANSTATAELVRRVYGLEAEVLHPGHALAPEGTEEPVEGLEPGYWLCVARLLAYKNVDVVLEALGRRRGEAVVVVGEGPDRARLRAVCPPGSRLLGGANDAQLRWLYRHARALVSLSYEDFGLTPVEAAAFGTPTLALRYGGSLDTVVEGETGVLVDAPTPALVAAAAGELGATRWDPEALRRHAERFSPDRFAARLRQVVAEEARAMGVGP